jgi:hypothetical protein
MPEGREQGGGCWEHRFPSKLGVNQNESFASRKRGVV